MDQKKIGSLLRELRKEKGLTQEQLAEQFGVSNRTVSRWENGSNMPDLSMLVEIADYYDVEIREILDGERKSENMMKEEKETLLKIADYAEKEKEIILNRICAIDIVGLLVMAVAIIIEMCDLGIASVFIQNMKDCMYGFGMGVILTNILRASVNFLLTSSSSLLSTFLSRAFFVALEIGLSRSDVLSTLSRPIVAFVIL